MKSELINQMMSHTSIRKFDPTFEIPKEDIDIIIKAGQQASTSALLQMYTLIEIPKEERQGEDTICGTQQFIRDASFFGIFFLDFYRIKRLVEVAGGSYNENYPSLELTMGTLDVGLMAQNMALAAESLGYGMCFCGACGDSGDKIFEKLNIPEKVLPLTGIAIGKSLESPKTSPRLPIDLIYHVGKYKEYTEEELKDGIKFVSEGLTEKRGSDVDWRESLKKRYEGNWAKNRNEKRKSFINQKLGNY